jgi:hypothetical protein
MAFESAWEVADAIFWTVTCTRVGWFVGSVLQALGLCRCALKES